MSGDTRVQSAEDRLSKGGPRPPEHGSQEIERCRQALALDPNCSETYYRLGSIYQDQGMPENAAVCFREALSINPADERFSFSLGWALQSGGCFEEAAEWYAHTLKIRPDCAPAWYNLGILHLTRAQYAQAVVAFKKSLLLQPQSAAALNNLGMAFMAQKHHHDALACFEAAIRLEPDFAEAHANLGRLLFEQQLWNRAAEAFSQALRIRPSYVEALHNLGLCHHKTRRLAAAEACYRRVLDLSGHHHPAHLDMGNICLDRGDLEGMADWYWKALRCSRPSADTLVNVGRMLQDQGRLDEALNCFDQALGINHGHADAHFNRALALLQKGSLEEGWKEYEWRFQKEEWRQAYPHRLPGPRWNGQDFSGKTLLVHCEQGLGDAIQFCRYLPMVKARGGTVVFETPAPLIRLFQDLAGIDDILTFSPKCMTTDTFDLHVPLLSLPGILGTTLGNIPDSVPYLFASAGAKASWKQRLACTELNIGIVWASSGWNRMLAGKSCGLSYFEPLARIQGIRMLGLQKGTAAREAMDLNGPADFINLGEEFTDFSDTAAVIRHLDLVISVDTSVAHLAGAMGKPVWVVLPFSADWRWQIGRDDCPWYPTMRLYRQDRRRNWQDVFIRVAADLQAMTRAATPQATQPGTKRGS